MADKDINIHVRTPGAAESRDQLGRFSKSVGDVGEKVEQSNKKQSESYQAVETKSESYFSKITKWAFAVFGVTKVIGEITKAIQLQTQAMEENAAMASKQQNALLRLQFLGEFYKEKPELRKEVSALAEYGRRPFEEVAGAYYNLRSKAGNLSQGQQSSIMKEALEMGRTDPAMQLDTLVDMFSLYAKLTGEKDANRIQNVLQKTVEQAGGTGADVANYMPQFLPVGLAGGLSGSQAAGLWSYVTTQTANPSIATTGLRASFMGLQGKGTPESAKLLKKFGVNDTMDFASKIDTLSGAFKSGKLTLGDAEQIAGREGSSILLSLLQNPQAMRQTMSNVVGADRGDVDLTGGMIRGLMGSDEIARSEEDIRLLNVAITNQRASDPDALRLKKLKLESELIARKTGAGEYGIALQRESLDMLTNIPGGSAEFADSFQRAVTPDKQYIENRKLLPSTYNYYNNVYIEQTPPDAGVRSSGGLR
jgi:hypothetical protein